MGKNKNRNQAGQDGATAAPRSRAAHHHPTFIERLIAAADAIYAKATMAAEMCVKKGVPEETTQVARDFIPVAEKYREVFFQLKNSGWTPPANAAQITIAEGDKIAIRQEAMADYDYIPGLAEGKTKLVAGPITVAGKHVKVLLLGEDGHPYGRATRSHLMLR
jgi:hypothetical protein